MDTLIAPAELLPQTGFRVWGIDPSSKRLAVAVVEGDGSFAATNVRLAENPNREARFADAHAAQVDYLKQLPTPALVFIEEPFVPRDRRQVPTHLLMYGVTLAALGEVLMGVPVTELTASQWKAQAMGKGNGFAKPAQYLEWAQSIGYEGRVEDEAAALGVAIGGAHLYLSQERSRTAA